MAQTQHSWRAKFLETAKSPGVPGVITMTPNGFRWAPNTPGAAPQLNAGFKSIKFYRASKAGSKKALIQLQAEVQYMFEFDNFGERDACRNIVAKYVPANAPATSNQASTSAPPTQASTSGAPQASTSASTSNHMNDVEWWAKMLQEDSEVQKLHQRLVKTRVLTDAEFFASRKRPGAFEKQKPGLPSAMLADIRPNADGRTNKVTFNLTPEIIHQIFAEKPAVHRAFLKSVPAKMTEVEFWTKYCRNEYLHRTKNAAAATAEAADDEDLQVFVNDDEFIANESRRKIKRVDPTLDMASDTADDLPEGTGAHRETVESKNVKVNTRLLRDINRHGEVVLEGRLLENISDTMTIARALAETQQQAAMRMEIDDAQERATRVARMTDLEDLRGPQTNPSLPLSIQDPRKYFDGQGSSGAGAGSSSTFEPDELMQRLKTQLEECKRHRVAAPIVSTSLSFKVLTELTQTISRIQHPLGKTTEKNVLDTLPVRLRDCLLQHSSTINELLKQFWATFPITSNTLLQKVNRLKDEIRRIYDELQDLKASLQSAQRHDVSRILQPMFQTLDAAVLQWETMEKRSASGKKSNEILPSSFCSLTPNGNDPLLAGG